MGEQSVRAGHGLRLVGEDFEAAAFRRRRQINLHGAEGGGAVYGKPVEKHKRVDGVCDGDAGSERRNNADENSLDHRFAADRF